MLRAASGISQLLIIVFQRQILRRGGKEEKPSQGPLPWSSAVTQELAVTLVPEKITAVDTEGSSDRPASTKHPSENGGGAVRSRDSRGLSVLYLLPPTRDGGPPPRWGSAGAQQNCVPLLCFSVYSFVSNSVHDANSSFNSAYFLFVSSLIHLH